MARDRLKEIEIALAHLAEDRHEAFEAGDFETSGRILSVMDRLEDEAAMIRECEADFDYHYGNDDPLVIRFEDEEIPF
jgi:uncharacterized protein YehS (DUF1456 family)